MAVGFAPSHLAKKLLRILKISSDATSKESNNLKRIENIQALRGIAALLVVIYHLIPIEQKYGGAETIIPTIAQFGLLGTDLFFVISGFVLVVIAKGKHKKFTDSRKFLFKRISRIYPTYWFYTLLVLIVFLIQPTWVNNSQGNQFDLLSSIFLLPSHMLPLVAVAWALVHFIYFYIVFSMIIYLVSEKNLGWATFIWAIGIILLNSLIKTKNPTLEVISHPVTLEFISGCLLASFYFKTEIKIKNSRLLLILITTLVIAVYAYLSYFNATGFIRPQGWWRPLLMGVPATIIVFTLIHAERNGYSLKNSLLWKIGNVSYSIYLSHVLTLSALGKIWHIFVTENTLDNFIMLPILIISVVIVGFLSYRYVEKPLIKLSRKII